MRWYCKASLTVLVIGFSLFSAGCGRGSYMSESSATIPADQEQDPDEEQMAEREDAEEYE